MIQNDGTVIFKEGNKSLGILVFFALLAIYGSKVSLFIAFFVSLVSLL